MCHKWLVKLFCTTGVITRLWHHPCQTYGDSSYLNEYMYIRLHVSRADKDEVAQKLSNYHAICKIIILSTEWSKNSCLACHNHWGCVWEWMYLNCTDGLIYCMVNDQMPIWSSLQKQRLSLLELFTHAQNFLSDVYHSCLQEWPTVSTRIVLPT